MKVDGPPTLVQFPISHFCEKVRWALDFKGVRYHKRDLIPGFHLLVTKRLAAGGSVPVLVDGDRIIQGSDAILDHLDASFVGQPLTPTDPALAQRCREIEAFADKEIGPHVRRICYHSLLESPKIVIDLFTQGKPAYQRTGVAATFPVLRRIMRKGMRIDEAGTRRSEQKLKKAIEYIESLRGGRDFLVGDQLSRADIAVCALLAPLWLPEGYGLRWPDEVPDDFADRVAPFTDATAWAQQTYASWRHAA